MTWCATKLVTLPGAARDRPVRPGHPALTVLANDALNALRPSDARLNPEWRLLNARMGNAIHRFSTPNAENTQALLIGVGYDPWPDWAWTTRRGQGVTPPEARATLNEWLAVRHAIAHGGPGLPSVAVLRKPDGSARLWRADAEAYMEFIKCPAQVTYDGIHHCFGGYA